MKSNKIIHHPSNNGDNFSDVGTEIEALRTAGAYNAVSASAAFSNDNRVLRSDGTAKGAQASAVTVDDSGNMSGVGTLATTGAITENGVAVNGAGKHTVWIPATAMVSRITNGPSTGTVETSTNKVMLKSLDFDATTAEYAQFSIRMPKSWDEGTVTGAFVWSHAATTTNFGVVWVLQGVAISDADAADAAFGTPQAIADTGGTTNTVYISSETPAITIGGSPAAQDLVVFQIYRSPSDGNDTMAIDARLHGITLFLTTDVNTDA
jgi:hypothetical protein